MTTLLAVEVRRWLRTRILFVGAFVAVFVGFTGPLSAFLLPELLALGVEDQGVEIEIPDATWTDMIASYQRSSAQLYMLVVTYLAGQSVALGSDERLQIFYRSRTTSGLRVYGPRLVGAAGGVLITAALGAGVALYETWALDSELEFDRAILTLFVGIFGALCLGIFGGAVAGILNSPFIATIVVLVLVFASELITTDADWATWIPMRIVAPATLLEDGELSDLTPSAATMAALAGVAIAVCCARRLTNRQPRTRSGNVD